MEAAKYKFAVHAMGRGLTTAKQRVLATGSLPIFAEQPVRRPSSAEGDSAGGPQNGAYVVDAYYGRFLRRNYHYIALRSGDMFNVNISSSSSGGSGGGGTKGAAPANLCSDLDRAVEWGRANGEKAELIGKQVRVLFF